MLFSSIIDFTYTLIHIISSFLVVLILGFFRGNNIHDSIVDEGASTCIMSLSCYKAIDSPQLSMSPTILKAFDGRNYQPCGILNSLQLELGGDTLLVEFEFYR